MSSRNIESKIEYMSRFMLEQRFESLSCRLAHRTRYMTLCLEDIFYPHNASAVIRSAEAFGLQELHVVESLTHFSPSSHIVRGTDQWIEINRWKDTSSLVESLRARGYRIVVTSPREGAYTADTFPVEDSPFALFMGTEKTGISDTLMELADACIYIPMVGFAESLNISVSAAIITERLTSRLRASSVPWQLPAEQQGEILLSWLMRSIKDSQRILDKLPEIDLESV